MLSQLLYNQPELRAPVLKALKVMVTSNTQNPERQDAPDDFVVPEDELSKNLTYLQSQAESWLAVLFKRVQLGRSGEPRRCGRGDRHVGCNLQLESMLRSLIGFFVADGSSRRA